MPGSPRFRELTRAECERVLRRNCVGRIAFARGNRLDIVPLHYLFADGVLCARTARETRLEKASENFHDAWPAAFEVDEVEGLFQWRSVVVHGNVHAAVEGGAEWRRNERAWQDAVQALRRLVPRAFTEGDPTAFRDVVIRMDVAEISGREARPMVNAASTIASRRRSGSPHRPGRRGGQRARTMLPRARPPRNVARASLAAAKG